MYIFNAILRNKRVRRISIDCIWKSMEDYLPIAIDSRNYERMNSILAESFGKPLPSFNKERCWLGQARSPFKCFFAEIHLQTSETILNVTTNDDPCHGTSPIYSSTSEQLDLSRLWKRRS